MSISVDDLVASLSSNHIGQEAIDLATLQKQLAQTLFSQAVSSSPRRGLPTTPTGRTPSSSISWDHYDFSRRRSSSVASAKNSRALEGADLDMEDEDERMVEDLLYPSSPKCSSGSAPSFDYQTSAASPTSPSFPSTHARQTSVSNTYDLPVQNTSLFATTDPFYLSQLQAAQNPTTSLFAQFGRPAPHSPFLTQPVHSHSYQHCHPISPEGDACSISFTSATFFTR